MPRINKSLPIPLEFAPHIRRLANHNWCGEKPCAKCVRLHKAWEELGRKGIYFGTVTRLAFATEG